MNIAARNVERFGDPDISHRRGTTGAVKEWCYLIAVSVRKDGIKVSGHANYAEDGKDIVCAGVTALTQTLIRSLEDLTRDEIQYEISPGRADIRYGNLSEEGKLLVDSFFIGVCQIADEFPDHVRIE